MGVLLSRMCYVSHDVSAPTRMRLSATNHLAARLAVTITFFDGFLLEQIESNKSVKGVTVTPEKP
jgi:hypothetical protein